MTLPLLRQFQHVLLGAALGGGWGLQQTQGSKPTIAEWQAYLAQVATDQAPSFQQVSQQIQAAVSAQCAESPYQYAVDPKPLLPDSIDPKDLEPWVNALMATLLHLRSQTRLLQVLSSASICDRSHLPSQEMLTFTPLQISAIGLLWQQLLLGDHTPEDFDPLLTRWSQILVAHNLDSDLATGFIQLEAYYDQDYTLQQVVQQLQSQGVTEPTLTLAMGWYSFRTTPQDWALSLIRATRSSPSPGLSGLLTGACSNLYNRRGLALDFGLSQSKEPINQMTAIPPDEILGQTLQPLLQSATQLFATWAGQLSSNLPSPAASLELLTVAIPRPLLYR